MLKNVLLLLLSLVLLSTTACKEQIVPVPKPRLYPRVDFPTHNYQKYEHKDCSFTFEYPRYATISQDKYKYEGQAANDCWFNLEIAELNASIYCDYSEVQGDDRYGTLVQDAFKIAGKHNVKANYREETVIHNQQGVGGLLFNIKGPVATPYQFYLTDTTQHFFRASLYFNSKVNPDSMQVIHEFVKQDIDQMIKTFEWKK